ncbi:retropepsin-like aspartic protease [Paenibacillus arenilitoris]|uniref:Retropepsin-like domain-containing protein n=1 Tax=Paenibacillus arenilitoris TaxID=2772299 RepID=A0A927CMX9_9BACL|nr:retropepsin-like aspartic protease [Paenibacillus arenilitoris]MBD2870360.1 retropepsin-like domain-containing protein [Paenibacillus arenilitoris]
MKTEIHLSNSDLPFIEITVYYNNQSLKLAHVLVDTGSSSTILKLDLVEEIGLTVELNDILGTISGVGGSEFVFFKTIDAIEVNGFRIQNFQVDIGTMNYGINIDGIIGMDFLLRAKGIIDLNDLILTCKQ